MAEKKCYIVERQEVWVNPVAVEAMSPKAALNAAWMNHGNPHPAGFQYDEFFFPAHYWRVREAKPDERHLCDDPKAKPVGEWG